MHTRLLLAAAAAVLAAGCIEPPAGHDSHSEYAQAVGEPDELGFPNPEEREMLVLTNQVRASASNQCGDWTELYGTEPRPPLVWNVQGAHGARFTARHLHDGACFQHESCCTLETKSDGSVGCGGDYIAPCGGACGAECAGGTSTADRYHLFDFTSFSGENLAAGNALATETICQWLHSDGHRENIYSGHNELGTGFFAGPGCFGTYWVQGFGSGARSTPRIPAASAIRKAQRPSTAASIYFAANYFDQDRSGAPQRTSVVVGNRCFDLARLWGSEMSGTYDFDPTDDDIPPGCHRYYFLFVDGDAERVTYPDVGTLGIAIGVDPATCPDYDPGPQAPADCEGGPSQCEEGAEEACYSGPDGTEGLGICHGGVRSCRNGFWTQCRRQTVPRPEICNGLDDDCDGSTDNGIAGVGSECRTAGGVAEGICGAGTNSCIAGRMVCISNVDPEPEVCNGIDDDCDGVIDDGFGQTSCGVGACHAMVQNCIVGRGYVCEPGQPEAETCTPRGSVAVDEDCDGEYDEGCSCSDGDVRGCYSGPPDELRGACQAGLMRCVQGAWGPCIGEVRPSPEVCDGLDNDCDGRVDEAEDLGTHVCGTGSCRAKPPVCRAATMQMCEPLAPGEEICNGLDDDCDGVVDEGCECQDGSSLDCFDGKALEIGVGACQAGRRSCVGGTWSDACEGQVLPTAEICDGIDQDCDGEIDEACVPAEVDPVEVDPGEDGGSEEGGCGCSGGSGAPGLALFATGLALLRRRQEKVA